MLVGFDIDSVLCDSVLFDVGIGFVLWNWSAKRGTTLSQELSNKSS